MGQNKITRVMLPMEGSVGFYECKVHVPSSKWKKISLVSGNARVSPEHGSIKHMLKGHVLTMESGDTDDSVGLIYDPRNNRCNYPGMPVCPEQRRDRWSSVTQSFCQSRNDFLIKGEIKHKCHF